jgi:putative membrane protein
MFLNNPISATLAGLFLSAVAGLAPAAAQQPQSLAADSAFIARAASAGLLQVKLGKLAEQKGTSNTVVEFGKRMAADYSKTNEDLKSAAKNAGFLAPVLLRHDQQIFDRFNSMGRSSFDKNYMSEMVRQHSEEVRLFERESTGGRVQSLKQLASQMLPELQRRLTLATQTAGAVGADVTASVSAADEGADTY